MIKKVRKYPLLNKVKVLKRFSSVEIEGLLIEPKYAKVIVSKSDYKENITKIKNTISSTRQKFSTININSDKLILGDFIYHDIENVTVDITKTLNYYEIGSGELLQIMHNYNNIDYKNQIDYFFKIEELNNAYKLILANKGTIKQYDNVVINNYFRLTNEERQIINIAEYEKGKFDGCLYACIFSLVLNREKRRYYSNLFDIMGC